MTDTNISRFQSALTREKNKTREEKAEDIAYTINHALVCAATDIIDPFVAAWSQTHLGVRLHTSWCNKTHDHGHDHDHGHSHDHPHEHHDHDHDHDHEHSHEDEHEHGPDGHGPDDHHETSGSGCDLDHDNPSFWAAAAHWLAGEAMGDLGAVPITIGFQRYAPGFMEWLNTNMETMLGKQYMKGAQQAARDWAAQEGKEGDTVTIQRHADELYRYEVRHFGQVAVWTVASVGLNIASQKLITGNSHPVSYMLLYKTLGAGTTAALLVGGRAYAPNKFHSWDKWTSQHVFTPATKTVSKLFGVDEQTVEATIRKKEALEDGSWLERAGKEKQESPER